MPGRDDGHNGHGKTETCSSGLEFHVCSPDERYEVIDERVARVVLIAIVKNSHALRRLDDWVHNVRSKTDESRSLIMAIRVVRLGSPRQRGEGLRLGTVRRPPRGVPKSEFASRNFYDVWLPDLAPSEELVKSAQAADDARAWQSFTKRYRAEMKRPVAARLLALLAALSQTSSLSVGCYCEDEARCHRSILKDLLAEAGARLE